MRSFITVLALAATAALPSVSQAQAHTKMVGGAAMYPTKDIIDNAVNSKDHTTLVAAVKAAGLVETLKGAGPFTVFAPTNAAFAKLPAGLPVMVAVRKKLTRNSLTAVGPNVLTLLIVPSWARVGVEAGNPGTLAAASGSITVEESLW